jgi:iron complex outermembrane recepter protein
MAKTPRMIRGQASGRRWPAKTGVAAAVFVALHGTPRAARADQGEAESSIGLQEVVVTATRREQSIESVPYNISVVSAEKLEATGVSDLATLATQVPGLSMLDYGARFNESTSPIIRGINATASPVRAFRSFEQSPVGTYIGNSPMDGYFQLDDLNRIEVLRGPQGTLYGAARSVALYDSFQTLRNWAAGTDLSRRAARRRSTRTARAMT